MKVLLIRNAYSWQYGGAEQFTHNLAVALREQNIETAVVTRVPELIAKCRASRIPVVRNIWLGNRARRLWWPVYALLTPLLVRHYHTIITASGADVVVAMSRDDQLFATQAAKQLGKPVVWVDHADMKHIVSSPDSPFRRMYLRNLALASRVVVPSQAETDAIFADLDPAFRPLFKVILNGASAQPARPLKHPDGQLVIAYVGRIERDKGVFELAEAMQGLGEAELWLAGKGKDEAKLKQYAETNGLAQRIRFLGHLDNVWELLLAADIFAYPTHHDAAPLAPAEAMLAGLPIVASNVGGVPEMVGDAAILIQPGDTKALSKALSQLTHDDKLRSQLAALSKKRGQQFNFDTIVKNQYIPLLSEVTK